MSNPFDHDHAEFRVLVNERGQHSLWPDFADVPAGWVVAHGPARRPECLEYVEENWQDITPLPDRALAVS
ncbi:MbtH family protein [Cellulosimicrobium funkei]|nr:MbtH family protein [Cellulosimicrobium funkei]